MNYLIKLQWIGKHLRLLSYFYAELESSLNNAVQWQSLVFGDFFPNPGKFDHSGYTLWYMNKQNKSGEILADLLSTQHFKHPCRNHKTLTRHLTHHQIKQILN